MVLPWSTGSAKGQREVPISHFKPFPQLPPTSPGPRPNACCIHKHQGWWVHFSRKCSLTRKAQLLQPSLSQKQSKTTVCQLAFWGHNSGCTIIQNKGFVLAYFTCLINKEISSLLLRFCLLTYIWCFTNHFVLVHDCLHINCIWSPFLDLGKIKQLLWGMSSFPFSWQIRGPYQYWDGLLNCTATTPQLFKGRSHRSQCSTEDIGLKGSGDHVSDTKHAQCLLKPPFV